MGGWGSGGIVGATSKGGGYGSGGVIHHHDGIAGGPATPAMRSHHGDGGGFLGGVGHFFSQGGSDLYHAAVNLPAGTYHLLKPLPVQAYDVARYGPRDLWGGKKGQQALKANEREAERQASGVVKGVKSDLRHPLRHPGYTALDVLGFAEPVASGLGRVGAASRVAAEGGRVGEVAKALARHPHIEPRVLRSGGLEVKPETSRTIIGSTAQKALDKALQRGAERPGRVGAASERMLNRKIGKTIHAEARMRTQIAGGAPGAFARIARKLTAGEQKALQVVAEEAPLEKRITAESARITGSRNASVRARHQAELDLLHKAKEHLTVKAGKPALASERLQGIYHRMERIARDRETLLKSLGSLSDEALQRRTTNAGRVAIGESVSALTKPDVPGQLSLDVPESGFQASEKAVRIPDVATRKGARAMKRQQVGSQGTVGHLRAPGSLTHEYTGALRENAIRRQDTSKLVAESGLEAARYAGLKHVHELIREAVRKEPSRPTDIAVRLDNLSSTERLPLKVRQYLEDPEEFYAEHGRQAAESAFEKVRSRLFIDPKLLDATQAAEFRRLAEEGKIGWVPRGMLGDLAKPQAPLTAVAGRLPVRVLDGINNASRFAILYLKPAYALPNLLGNAALNILQQGWAAVPNLTKAARLDARLGPELAARIDAAMGEGLSQAISSHGQGIGAKAVDAAARFWSKGVDTPFRRASFLFEAQKAGYRAPAAMEELLTDPSKIDDLTHIALRANREIIDYANLGPLEREVIRRIIFFYPWVKGSTIYAGRLLREHPVKAAVGAQVGHMGYEETQQELGSVPSYLEGAFPVGGELVNPASAAILQTPAQVGLALQGLLTGNIPQVAEASQFATPALDLAASLALRRNLSTGYQYPKGTNAATIANDTLIGGLPQTQLIKQLLEAHSGEGGSKLYPPETRSAIMHFLFGGLAPRPYNAAELHALAAREATGR